MISKGTLVKYVGEDKKTMYYGRLLMVHERDGDKVVVWDQRKGKGDYTTKTLSSKEVEEGC